MFNIKYLVLKSLLYCYLKLFKYVENGEFLNHIGWILNILALSATWGLQVWYDCRVLGNHLSLWDLLFKSFAKSFFINSTLKLNSYLSHHFYLSWLKYYVNQFTHYHIIPAVVACNLLSNTCVPVCFGIRIQKQFGLVLFLVCVLYSTCTSTESTA